MRFRVTRRAAFGDTVHQYCKRLQFWSHSYDTKAEWHRLAFQQVRHHNVQTIGTVNDLLWKSSAKENSNIGDANLALKRTFTFGDLALFVTSPTQHCSVQDALQQQIPYVKLNKKVMPLTSCATGKNRLSVTSASTFELWLRVARL